MVGLQDRKPDLKLGKLRKNMVCGNVKCSRLEPQDKGLSAYPRQLFSNYNFFLCFYVDFTDIDECKGNHSCHVNAACMNTLGSHVCQCHAGYTGNGANCTGKFNLFSTICRIVLHDTFDYSAAPFSCVARQLDDLSRGNLVILFSRVHLLECSSRYLMRI